MRIFAALVLETLRDAMRRRGLIAAAIASAGAALLVQRCGSCEAAMSVQGESVSMQGGELGAVGALVGFALVTLWTYAVTALLASDGLATALEDGTAEAVLARPVSRDVFVLARLCGVWAGAFAIGLALLGLLAGLAIARQGLPALPTLSAALAVAVGAFGVTAFAMLASLLLPRAATLLLLSGVGLAVVGMEVAGLVGGAPTGATGVVITAGPAWIAAPVDALAPWLSSGALPGPPPWPAARALAWSVALTAALLWRFRSLELPR